MADYGRLARRSLDEMIAGARVDIAPYKQNPMDFVLWKPSHPGEPAWPSPAAIATPGRPGWHIECSAMSWKHLGETFDIHGGGIDLIFPHHENEIAQSRCAFHSRFMANYWVHNGFLQVEGQKMSKSLGNFFTIRDLLKDWPGAVLRLQMLMTHYRQPLDWTRAGSEQAAVVLDSIAQLTNAADSAKGRIQAGVFSALDDDLNTPEAIAALHVLMGEARRGSDAAACDLLATCTLLGIDPRTANLQDMLKRQRGNLDEAKIESLISARKAAREAKDFAEADRIRDELAAMGIVVKDSKAGTTWELAR
jgi:cysteinyl-tRNA synthetase